MAFEDTGKVPEGLDKVSFLRGQHFEIQECLSFARAQYCHYRASHQDKIADAFAEVVNTIENERNIIQVKLEALLYK